MQKYFVGVIALLSIVDCSRDNAPSGGTPPSSTAPSAPRESLGNVMVQVARRFEIAGRAANANRFELAEFEAGEIEELFETDVPGAELPKEGPTAHIPAMAKAFLQTTAPELRKTAAAKDRAAFAAAFQRAASACNACHQASAKGFIQVPSEPGRGVPDLDPQPASSATSH
jgi:mono/diheme cytochrome c family protein